MKTKILILITIALLLGGCSSKTQVIDISNIKVATTTFSIRIPSTTAITCNHILENPDEYKDIIFSNTSSSTEEIIKWCEELND